MLIKDTVNQIGGLFHRGKAELLFFFTCMAYFGGKVIFFALRIKDHIFPDEASWFGMAQVFSRSLMLPVDSPESFPFGLVTHIPYLYFFLMGKLLVCNILPIDDLIFLRLVNGLLALLTVTFAWRVARALGIDLLARALFMVILTNTVMFTFISASVNNDNLSTLLAVLSLYYLIRFFQERSLHHALLFTLFVLSGMLTKSVFIPYGLGLVLIALFHEKDALVHIPKSLFDKFTPLTWRKGILSALCLTGLVANLALYGGNLIRFGALLPTMDDVLPVEDSMKNRLFARDYVVRQFKGGQLTLLDAQRLALQIRDPGDRASAWTRLAEAEKERDRGPSTLMGRWQYAVQWAQVMVARTYSVAAHLSLYKFEREYYPYYAIFILAGVFWFFHVRDLLTPDLGTVAFILFFYGAILMQGVGYTIYRGSGLPGVALTGRYMFPVLVPLYLLTAQALLAKKPRWWQATAGLLFGFLFVAGEFPWFLRQAGSEWYF